MELIALLPHFSSQVPRVPGASSLLRQRVLPNDREPPHALERSRAGRGWNPATYHVVGVACRRYDDLVIRAGSRVVLHGTKIQEDVLQGLGDHATHRFCPCISLRCRSRAAPPLSLAAYATQNIL